MRDPVIRIDRIKDHPGAGLAALDGPIDARRMLAIQDDLDSERGRGFRTLILDLEQVRYLNSLGMSSLVNLADQLTARGGGLHLAGAQPKVKLILEMMGLDEYFRLHGSIASALRAIRPARESVRQNSSLTR